MCKDCPYYWRNDDERYAQCHWVERCPDDKAPCEYDDNDYVDEAEYYDYE